MQKINLNEIKILPLDVKNVDDIINIQNGTLLFCKDVVLDS